ncbi:MAG: tetratricopeptide repeat protein [Wujia sp.]
MDIWQILGIKETKDKGELKKAYRRKLTKTNPEDNPEKFMELRSAYEEAVRLSDLQNEPKPVDESDMGILLSDIEKLYKDYWRRIEVKSWEELFDSDIFVSLTTGEEAFKVLIKFLMNHFYLPRQVWSLICETFDIKARRRELCESIPEDFLDYMINNASFDDILDYNLMDGAQSEFDSFIELYYHMDAAIRRKEISKQEELLNKLDGLDVYHPYKELCRIRHKVQVLYSKNINEANDNHIYFKPDKIQLQDMEDELNRLNEKYPNTIPIINCCGDLAMLEENFERAKSFYDISYSLAPDNYIVMGKQAEVEYALGNYKRSRDLYLDLLKINHYDNNVRAGMIRANQGLVEMYQARVKENSEDNESRLEMAWSLYQSYRFDEAIDVLNEFEPSEDKICEYNNLKGRTYLCIQQYDKALVCFLTWKETIEAIPDEDQSEEAVIKRKRYEYVNFLIADCHLKRGEYEEARKHFEIALKKEHDEILLSYEAMCELEYETKNYEACILACEKLIERDSRSYTAYDYMAKAQFKLGFLNETLSACERAIAIYPYVSEPYALEMEIFLEVEQLEGAKRTLERFRVFNIDSDRMDYYEALLLGKQNKHQQAMALLTETIRRGSPKGTDMKDYDDLYFLYGNICESLGENEKAIGAFLKTAELNNRHQLVYGKLGMLYERMGKLKEACEMFSKQLDNNPQAYYYIQRAILQRFFGNYKSALKDFNEALKHEPNNSYCHEKIGLIYELHREFEKALESYNRAYDTINGEEQEAISKRKRLLSLKARTLQCMNRFEESQAVYNHYLETFGYDADVAYDYAELLQRMNKVEAAIAVLTECIEKVEYDEGVQACMRQLISIYGEEGYLDRANETFMLALTKKDKDIRAYAAMARVLRERGVMEHARELYMQCVSLDIEEKENYYSELIEVLLAKKTLIKPNISVYIDKAERPIDSLTDPQSILKLVRLRRVQRNYKKALEYANKALSMKRCRGCFYGKCHEALYAKALVYEKMKEYELAALCYKEAIAICGHNAIYEERLKRIEKNDSRN